MLTYSQSTGEMRAADGDLIGIGFSGFDYMQNKPEFEDVLHGPIPKRTWAIDAPQLKKDSWILLLRPISAPVARTALGRFSIQTSDLSHGCINLPKEAVVKLVELWNKRERTLRVIA